MGLNGIRILGSSLGPNSEPYRWKPALFPEPSKQDESVFKGLDYLLHSLKKRNMKAIVSLSDFWHDSGGFGHYIKSLDQNHLLTSGLEGKGNDSGKLFIRTHSSPYLDFATVHLWRRMGETGVDNTKLLKQIQSRSSNNIQR
ncbi:hypothetical protein CLOM_g1314 [Closterium sp. NIES-68]|nr:hypothetical protein CLOM_g1314 [Closterium sp. NIES-68]